MSTQTFAVDLRKYGPGVCVGDEKIIVTCPVCKRGAYCEKYSSSFGEGYRFVHAGTLSNGAEGLKWKRTKVCRVRFGEALEP